MRHCAKFCTSVKQILRFFDCGADSRPSSWIFKSLADRVPWRVTKCIIVPNCRAIGRTLAEIWPFFDFSRWRSPPSWIFKTLNLTVELVKRVELRHLAKFCVNHSKCGRHMAIFRPFNMAAAAILDFLIFEILTVGTLRRAKLHHLAKFRGDPSSRC